MRTYQRKGVWYIDYSYNGTRVRRRVGCSKKMAELALKEIELKIAKGEFLGIVEHERATFDELCKEYLRFSEATKRPQVYRRDRIIMKNMLRVFSGVQLNNVSAYGLEEYKMERRKEVSPSTVNRELTCVKHMFNKAVEWGYLRHHQLRAVRQYKEPPGRTRYLTKDEIELLIEHCSEHLRPIVITALNTGMRKGEILNLAWKDVDMGNRVINVRISKNNESRAIPMNETIFKALKLLGNKQKDEPVFVNKDGKLYADFRKSFSHALEKAGIKDFTFHDLRHTFASQLAMSGSDIKTIQELLGHKDIRMTMRYSHLSNGHLREAVNSLNLGSTWKTPQVSKPMRLTNWGFQV